MNQEVQNSVVIVTGAGQGIGRAVAAAYAAEGARVVVAEVQEAAGKQTVQDIQAAGGEGIFIRCDVSAEADVVNLMRETVQAFGRIDVLINNAGIADPHLGSPYELKIEDWDRVMNTNARGCFLAAREAAKEMRKTGGGAIVNLSSTRYLMSEPNTEAYAASKGAIASLTHALAVSLGPDGIRVNQISPGWIETGDYEALRAEDHSQHPAGRVGRPEDIARACLFLTDPRNDFITGEGLVIDGGMTRKMIYEP
ncbi:glucose 1-dehydrogenase [Paenibacillus sp. CN-4]|uniref:glucose 1-dehydrogenase n=1 Tax=Paenibacillus nanchangensis TaxID=3348343 RepID=UPI00397C95FF